MRHVVVSRFSVPSADQAAAERHRDPLWLAGRCALFRRYVVPSVGRLRVPMVLLCSSESAGIVTTEMRSLPWVRVVEQNDWYGGWTGAPNEMVTRLDSDDALHEDWFGALERAPAGFEAYCTKTFLRLDGERGALYRFTVSEPSPLAAFSGGANPYTHDHKDLERCYAVHEIRKPYLLQVVHGGNLRSRCPPWWRFDRRVSRRALTAFGM